MLKVKYNKRELLNSMRKLVFSNFSGYIVVLFVSFIATSFMYAYPIIYSKIIDDGVVQKNTNSLLQYGLLYIVLILLQAVIEYISFRITLTFENSIFRKLQQMAFEEIVQRKTFVNENNTQGEMNAFSLNDIPTYMRYTSQIFLSFPLILATLILSALLMLYIHWTLAIMIILVQLTIIIIRSTTNKSIEKAAIKRRKDYSNLVSVTLEAIKGGSILQLLGATNYLRRKYSHVNDSYIERSQKTAIKTQTIQLLSGFSIQSVTVLQMLVLGFFVIAGQLTIGKLFSFVQYANMFSSPISSISSLFAQLAGSSKELEKCTKMINRQASKTESDKIMSIDEGNIVVKNLFYAYESQKLFEAASVNISKGCLNFLLGDSGSGKSTFLAMIAGEIAPPKGTIFIDSADLFEFSQSQICSQVSLVTQIPMLFSDTIWNNLTLGIDYPKSLVEKSCKECQIDGLIANKGGYDTSVEESGQNFSLGERQRICLARALLQNKPILLLDEVTSGLDEQNAQNIEQIIENIAKNRTVICVSHVIRRPGQNYRKFRIQSRTIVQG